MKIWSYQFVGDFQVPSTSFCDRALLDFVFHCYVRMGVNIYVADLVPCRFEALVAGNIFSAAQSLSPILLPLLSFLHIFFEVVSFYKN